MFIKEDKVALGSIDLVRSTIQSTSSSTLLGQILEYFQEQVPEGKTLEQVIEEEVVLDIPEQDTLENTFEENEEGEFQFILTYSKVYPLASEEICTELGVTSTKEINPPNYTKTYQEGIENAMKYAHDFEDFILLLEEVGNDIKGSRLNAVKRKLMFLYHRSRAEGDTGRLVYRLHCLGFLRDYTIDYVKRMYVCKLYKAKNIDYYFEQIKTYLSRYLSENMVKTELAQLKQRSNKDTLLKNVRECLYYLTEFSYEQIAQKRKWATNEIESLILDSTEEENNANWFEQNKFIKENIYYYFNAKYARHGFQIDGKSYSLLGDYTEVRKNLRNKKGILKKYLKVLNGKDGTAQNNYNHMIGSCRKIMRSLVKIEYETEWVLRLLNSFSSFSVNKPSYINKATTEMKKGLYNLVEDKSYHNGNYELVEHIIDMFEQELRANINNDSKTFRTISKIKRLVLLKKLNTDIGKLHQQISYT